tara:strand:+ start:323 stop:541 length:219 start_codon:yes stop_codon:yes gene_type:complete
MKQPIDKIDTQGMSGVSSNKGFTFTSTTKYTDGYPSFVPLHNLKMLDGDLRSELKELIHEVLDEGESRMYGS